MSSFRAFHEIKYWYYNTKFLELLKPEIFKNNVDNG